MRIPTAVLLSLLFFADPLSGQTPTASSMLSSAIYEEEVSGNLEKATGIYLDILKRYPDDRPVAAKALYHLGLLTEKMGKQKADDYFTRLIKDYPDQKELVALAKARLAKFESQTSEVTLKAETSFRLASDHYRQFNYKTAAAEYEKVIQLAPNSSLAPEAQLWAGQCYLKAGINNQALTAFNSLIRNYPHSTLVPVAELMISQVKLTMAKYPDKPNMVTLDDGTILDPGTGIKFTRINSLAGKNDIITSAVSITDIAPNRNFLLADNKVIPFDNSAPYDLFQADPSRRNFSRLSPDGSRIAFLTDNAISVVPVSPMTGRTAGPVKQYQTGGNKNGGDLNWAPDGQTLVFSQIDSLRKTNFWTFSMKDGSKMQVTNSSRFVSQPVFSKNGANILYKQIISYAERFIKMSSVAVGKSLTLLDSAFYNNRFILSPDNQWILYEKTDVSKYLYRLSDRQEQKLSVPEVIGDFISWGNDSNKVLFYSTSVENQDALKIVSAFGGPGLNFGNQSDQYPESWPPNSNSLIAREKDENGKWSLKRISLMNQELKTFENLPDGDVFSFSPNFSNILVIKRNPNRQPIDLYIWPVSLKECKITGEPTLFFKGYIGWGNSHSWSPDGKKIALCSDGELWICKADGGPALQLTKTQVKEEYPLWSPEGSSIAVFNEGNQLQIVRTTDGEVVFTRELVDSWDWSPDGRELVMACYDSLLYTYSTATGNTRILANWREYFHGSYLDEIKWSPDGKWIALNGPLNEIDFVGLIYLVNPADGKFVEVAAEDTRTKQSLLWSPDGKWISYYSSGPIKTRLEGILWEADLTEFIRKMKAGTETGISTDFDFSAHLVPAGGVAQDGTFTDSRDGHVYPYKKIGELTWMAENLAYLPEVYQASDSSTLAERYYVYGYDGKEVEAAKSTINFKKYGVLYNNAAARKACHAGWHLPDDSEWMELESSLGMNTSELNLNYTSLRCSGDVGQKLKSMLWGEDDIFQGLSGFNALPGGYRQSVPEYFKGAGSMTELWVNSTPNDPKASARMIASTSSGVARTLTVRKTAGFSVRCVKDNMP